MDKKTITIVVGVIVAFIILRWIVVAIRRRDIPFINQEYQKSASETNDNQ